MMRVPRVSGWLGAVAAAAALALGGAALASRQDIPAAPDQAALERELAAALAGRRAAEARSARFDQAAREAEDAAARAAGEAAALAARVQEAEAGIVAMRARIALLDRQRAALRERIGKEQRPLARLTAALQQFTRRPVALALLRPGSVEDLVYLRAVLDHAAPQVRQRTAAMRRQLEDARTLRAEAEAAVAQLRQDELALSQRRRELAEIETRQRLAARAAGGSASREQLRALALAEELRDLDALMAEFDRASALAAQLAALPGPQLRPARLGGAGAAAATPAALPAPAGAAAVAGPPQPYLLPVAGRTLAGFGSAQAAGRSTGITLAPLGGAQVVAPGGGRIAFAGPYQGFGTIVIVTHGNGWTSLVTGMARASVAVGEEVEAGAPIGTAPPSRPQVTLELRRDGAPVNPLAYLD